MENRESILFPQESNEGKITSFAFVKDYLIYTTDVKTNLHKMISLIIN